MDFKQGSWQWLDKDNSIATGPDTGCRVGTIWGSCQGPWPMSTAGHWVGRAQQASLEGPQQGYSVASR